MTNYLRAIIFSLIFLLSLDPTISYSQKQNPQASKTYEGIRERYLKLRNTDRQIIKRQEWEDVIARLSSFMEDYSGSKEAPSAMMYIAIMNEEIYRRFKEEDYLDRAIAALLKIVENYKNSDSADEALFKVAELFIKERRDYELGKRYLKQIIANYPDRDMAEAARIRLNELNGKVIAKPSTSDPLKQSGRVIVLDPGHGGEDLGAIGVGGLYEKDVTLLVALEVKKIMEERGGVVVRLTRQRDEFVPLMDRTSYANDFQAEIFVSLHVNASPSKKLSGFEIYYLDNTGDKASKTLAERENASINYEGAQADVQYMLSDLIQNVKLEDSIQLANVLKRSIITQLHNAKFSIKDLGVKKAPFYVLVGAHMPCVLVEMSFIDHSTEGANLGKKEYRRSLAEGVSSGISTFLGL